MTFPNGVIASYKYNADGIRTQKTVGGVTTDFFLEGSTIVAQKTGNDVIWYYFDGDGTRDAIEYGGKVYYYMYNPQGDVIGLFDDYLNVVVEYTYDSWGKIIDVDDTSGVGLATANPFRYRGYYYDEESGLYYLNSRYYHPEIGRFINADEYIQTGQSILDKNMFAYCGNNPVVRIDSQGNCWDYILDVGFIAWSISDVISNPSDWKKWAALAVDVVFAVVPFVPSGGGQVIKLADLGDKIHDFSKVTVVGESMNRVKTVSQFVNATDNLYDGFKFYDKLTNLGSTGKVLAEIGGKTSNLVWLYGKVRKGYTIVDIGVDSNRLVRSSSYCVEKIFLTFWKSRNVSKLIRNIYE